MVLDQKPSLLSQMRAQFAEGRSHWKAAGFKGVARRYGWKFLALFFFYYLIRDITLYIVIPYLVAQKVF